MWRFKDNCWHHIGAKKEKIQRKKWLKHAKTTETTNFPMQKIQ